MPQIRSSALWALCAAALALAIILALAWPRQKPGFVETPSRTASADAQTPAEPPPAPTTPQPAEGDAAVHWGGAWNSARRDGSGFFDRNAARAFVGGVPPELSKYVVELNARAFLPEAASEMELAALPREQPAAGHTLYLQFIEHPTAAQRAELAAAGLEIMAYMSGYAWTARGSTQAFQRALKLSNVRAIAQVDARDRLHPQVYFAARMARGVPPYALASDGRARFSLLTQPGATAGGLRAQLSGRPALAQAEVKDAPPSVLGPRFEVIAAAESAAELAGLSAAAFVEFMPPPVASRDAVTDDQSNVTDIRDGAPSLSGSGISVAVREIGKPDSHVDFSARLQLINNDGTGGFDAAHATAVTGQIGSSGVTQPTAKGIAPAVSLLGYSLTGDTFLVNDIVDAASRGARISNHSYGPSGLTVWGDYQTVSADWDTALRNSNLIGTFAGNEETGNLFQHIDFFVGAKNTICVGAASSAAHAGDDSPLRAKSDGIASFSEFGPMADGRIKPDLVAFGDSVTLDTGASGVTTNSGTSFSTPAVCGVAALVFQHFKTKTGAEPSAALAKALLCNSATDLGQTGPDPAYGFGIVNAEAAVRTIDLRQSASVGPFFEGVMDNGGTASFTAIVENSSQLKLTLCWLDVAGTPAASRALVNDLDVELTAPGGATIFPFSLNPASVVTPATSTARNSVDTVEQIVVNNPANGTWTITVKGTSIPTGPQPFAVVLNQPTQPLPLVATILASPTKGAAPLSVSFSAAASTGNISSYLWSFGDGASGTGSEVQHTYGVPGTYTAFLAISDAQGRQQSASVIITVVKREVSVFPSRALARLDFRTASRSKFEFTVVVRELVLTPQEARDAVTDNLFEGQIFDVRVNGSKMAQFEVDRKGMFKSKAESLTMKPTRGEITVNFKGNPELNEIFANAGMTKDIASSGVHELPVEIEISSAVYKATLLLDYTNKNGKTGIAKE